MLRLLHFIQGLLLILDGGIQQLLGIILAHLGLLLLLLLLVVLFILILIRLLLVFILVFIIIVLVAATLVLLILVLFFFLVFAENEVITGLVIVGIQTERILIRLDSLTKGLLSRRAAFWNCSTAAESFFCAIRAFPKLKAACGFLPFFSTALRYDTSALA